MIGYPHQYPDGIAYDPRIITMECRECQRQWFVLIPEEHPRRFCEDLRCKCGSAWKDLKIKSGEDKLRTIIHGSSRYR